jgi:hypothetical protein
MVCANDCEGAAVMAAVQMMIIRAKRNTASIFARHRTAATLIDGIEILTA